MTYHDRQHSVDFANVILGLVEDVDRDARVLTAEAANAARFEGLHVAYTDTELSGALKSRYSVLAILARRLSTALSRATTSHARASTQFLALACALS